MGTKGHLVMWSEGGRKGEAALPLPRRVPTSLIRKSLLFLRVPRHLPLAPVHWADASGGNPGLMGSGGGPGSEEVSHLGEASLMTGMDTSSDKWGD